MLLVLALQVFVDVAEGVMTIQAQQPVGLRGN
jgi:hypothetical protein